MVGSISDIATARIRRVADRVTCRIRRTAAPLTLRIRRIRLFDLGMIPRNDRRYATGLARTAG